MAAGSIAGSGQTGNNIKLVITEANIKDILWGCHIQSPKIAAATHKYIDSLNTAMAEHSIDANRSRQAHFLAQVLHESQYLLHIEENLNYSAERLPKVFPKIEPEIAKKIAHNNEEAAKYLYFHYNTSLGNKSEDDAWHYIGRGLIQMTGKSNYAAFQKELESEHITTDVLKNPDLLATDPLTACRSACYFWSSHNLNHFADLANLSDNDDKPDLLYFQKICKTINARNEGYTSRKSLWDSAVRALKVRPLVLAKPH
ncbi:MAG: hypothetical protein HQK94_14830 [Nitrospirae bacterium]|nr:hypothetical protein [Nitrospirota bacterium]